MSQRGKRNRAVKEDDASPLTEGPSGNVSVSSRSSSSSASSQGRQSEGRQSIGASTTTRSVVSTRKMTAFNRAEGIRKPPTKKELREEARAAAGGDFLSRSSTGALSRSERRRFSRSSQSGWEGTGTGTGGVSGVSSVNIQRKQRARLLFHETATVVETAASSGRPRSEIEELVESFRDDTIFRETVGPAPGPSRGDYDDDDEEEEEGDDESAIDKNTTTEYKKENTGGGGSFQQLQQARFDSDTDGETTVNHNDGRSSRATGAFPAPSTTQGGITQDPAADGKLPLGFYSCTACDHKFTQPSTEELTMDALRDIYHHCGSAQHRTRLRQLFPASKRLQDEPIDPQSYIVIHINGIPSLVCKELGGSTHFSAGRAQHAALAHGAQEGDGGFEGRATDLLDLGSSLFYPVEQFQTENRIQAQSRRSNRNLPIRKNRVEFADAVDPQDANPLEFQFLETRPEAGPNAISNFGGCRQSDLTAQLNACSKLAAQRGLVGLETRMRLRHVKWGSAEDQRQADIEAFQVFRKEQRDGEGKTLMAVKPEFSQIAKSPTVVKQESGGTTMLIKQEPFSQAPGGFSQRTIGAPQNQGTQATSNELFMTHLKEEVLLKTEFPVGLQAREKTKDEEKRKKAQKQGKPVPEVKARGKSKERRDATAGRNGLLYEVPRDLAVGKHASARLRIDKQGADEVLTQYNADCHGDDDDAQAGGDNKADPLVILEEGETEEGKPWTVIDLTHLTRVAPDFSFDPVPLRQAVDSGRRTQVKFKEEPDQHTQAQAPRAQQHAEAESGFGEVDQVVGGEEMEMKPAVCNPLRDRVSVQEGDCFRLSWFIRGFKEVKKTGVRSTTKMEPGAGGLSQNQALLHAHLQEQDNIHHGKRHSSAGGSNVNTRSSANWASPGRISSSNYKTPNRTEQSYAPQSDSVPGASPILPRTSGGLDTSTTSNLAGWLGTQKDLSTSRKKKPRTSGGRTSAPGEEVEEEEEEEEEQFGTQWASKEDEITAAVYVRFKELVEAQGGHLSTSEEGYVLVEGCTGETPNFETTQAQVHEEFAKKERQAAQKDRSTTRKKK